MDVERITPYGDGSGDKTRQVREMFDSIAPAYDFMNRAMTMGIDRLWRHKAVRLLRDCQHDDILDIATGTGDLAIAMARALPEARITGVDLSPEMLAVARHKVSERGLAERIRLEEGDAEQLALPSAEADTVTVAFGVRNFDSPERGLSELHRLLRPGGRIVVLEFSQPRNRLFGALYRWYSFRLLPFIGGLVSREKRAYEYLPASVSAFPSGEAFLALLRQAGFTACQARSLSGGIAHIYIGTKR